MTGKGQPQMGGELGAGLQPGPMGAGAFGAPAAPAAAGGFGPAQKMALIQSLMKMFQAPPAPQSSNLHQAVARMGP